MSAFPMIHPSPAPAFPMRRQSIARIQEVVADFYDIPVAEMVSARRALGVSHPRQMAMFLACELTPLSLPVIGRHFGGRDHTTVIHAVKQVKRRTADTDSTRAAVATLRERLC